MGAAAGVLLPADFPAVVRGLGTQVCPSAARSPEAGPPVAAPLRANRRRVCPARCVASALRRRALRGKVTACWGAKAAKARLDVLEAEHAALQARSRCPPPRPPPILSGHVSSFPPY